jgi:uncharacterized membrane protein
MVCINILFLNLVSFCDTPLLPLHWQTQIKQQAARSFYVEAVPKTGKSTLFGFQFSIFGGRF